MAFTPKVPSGQYWQVDLDANVVKVGPNHGSLTAISNVISWTVAARPDGSGNLQMQLIVTVYDPAGNQAIINQAPQVLPDGYTDFKGYKPRKYLRSTSGDVVDILAGSASSSSESDAYCTGTSTFGADGDAILQGQHL